MRKNILAIHNGPGYNDYLRKYLDKENIPYILVSGYDSNIIEILKENNVSHFFWHFNHIIPKDILMSRYLLFSLEEIGIQVYPNFRTSWHFDDKVAQKYLLEAFDTEVVPSWVFYDLNEALSWIDKATFPIVSKLRRGAGSYNVVKLDTKSQAKLYAKKMFSKGLNPAPKAFADISTKITVARKEGGIKGIINRAKKAPNFIRTMLNAKKNFPNELGYVYFQKFIAGTNCDYRVAVVGDYAWGSKRLVRNNDFRASGAGQSLEDPNLIPLELVNIAFETKEKLNVQSIAFDFVLDKNDIPYIVEVSYCFGFDGDDGTFFWDRNLNLHKKSFDLGEMLYKVLLNEGI